MGVMVLHYGLGNIETLPPGPAGAQAEIGILAVEEETVVEAANVVQHTAAVERRRAAGHEDFFEHRKILGEAAVAALLARAVARHQHAGGIQAGLAEEADLGSAHAGVGAGIEGGDEGGEPTRMSHGIVVEGGDIGRRGSAPALVDGRAETGIVRILNHARARRGAIAAYQALAAIVDDHHFEIRHGLPGKRLHALEKPRIRGEGGDYHRYEEVRQFLILPCGGGGGGGGRQQGCLTVLRTRQTRGAYPAWQSLIQSPKFRQTAPEFETVPVLRRISSRLPKNG